MQDNSLSSFEQKMQAFAFNLDGLNVKAIVRYLVDYQSRTAKVKTTSVSIDGTLCRSLESYDINDHIESRILFEIDMLEFKPLEPA